MDVGRGGRARRYAVAFFPLSVGCGDRFMDGHVGSEIVHGSAFRVTDTQQTATKFSRQLKDVLRNPPIIALLAVVPTANERGLSVLADLI